MRIISDHTALVGEPLSGVYDPWLVVLSYLIASAAAFVALLLIGELRTQRNATLRPLLHGAAALSLGGGVWSMHFVAMLAFTLPVQFGYDIWLTLISFIMPVAVAAVGLYLIREGVVRWPRLWLTGSVLGLSICAMHYTGMAAMRGPVEMVYRADLFAASVLVAIAAAVSALWMALRFSSDQGARAVALKGLSAMLMGVAVAGMHYTGMAATVFLASPARAQAGFQLDAGLMAFGITSTVVIIFCLSLLIAGIDERLSGRHRIGLLVTLMAIIAMGVGGTAIVVLYDAWIDEYRARVVGMAKTQARFIEAVARFDAAHYADTAGGAIAATMGQVRDAHSAQGGFGGSGEFNLARRVGDGGALEYLLAWRAPPVDDPAVLALARLPMRKALAGESGTLITVDHRGTDVLVAYEPLAVLDAGIVAKIDIEEIRQPFMRAALVTGAGAVLLILIGTGLVQGIGNPLVRQLEEKERLEVELAFARAVQTDLLPEHPPTAQRFEFAARTVPARFVGGDFYDFIELDPEHLGVLVGDVSGKGISAALYMARLLGDFRYVCKLERDPGDVLTRINKLLKERSTHAMFASAIYMVVNLTDGSVELANAGHHAVFVGGDGESPREAGRASGPPLGVLDTHDYRSEHVALARGQCLLAFTDGATEPEDAAGEEFGAARLASQLGDIELAAALVVERSEAAIEAHTGGAPQFDDFTLVAIRATR